MMIKLIKKNFLFVCLGLLGFSNLQAQTPTAPATKVEVNADELKNFAQAYQEIQMANQGIQKKMMDAVKAQNIDIKTFNEIHTAKMQNKVSSASKEDMANYEKAIGSIETMQGDFQKKVEGIITDQGLTVARFQEISAALQTDKDLQERLKKILMG